MALRLLLVGLLGCLAAAAWLLSAPLGLPPGVAPWATVVALLVALLVALHALAARWRQRRSSRRRARDPGLLALCSHILQELARLRETGADHVPWVIVIGPPGVGKTAALWRSGLGFQQGLDPQRFVLGDDLQPTDRVAFYRSDVAVFIDTAGRYTTSDTPSDRAEWRLLLDLIASHGSIAPLAGVLVVSAANELLADDAHAGPPRFDLARARVDELQAALDVQVPVYLLCTKLDLLAGLGALVSALPGDRLGFAVELAGPGAEAALRVAERHLVVLQDALERAAFDASASADLPQERAELLAAPALFARLCARIGEAVAELFPDHGSRDAPIWRAICFASAGAPAPFFARDPLGDERWRSVGAPPLRSSPGMRAPGRARLLGGLFAELLPADRWISRRRWSRRRSQLRARILRQAGLALAAAGLVALFVRSSAGNHRLLVRASQALVALAADRDQQATPIELASIAPLQALAHELREHRVDGPPWALRWGLYQGDALAGPALRLYLSRANHRLLGPVIDRAAEQLRALIHLNRRSGAEAPKEAYRGGVDALRLYLLLTHDDGRFGLITLGEPGEEAHVAQRIWLSRHLAEAWASALSVDPAGLVGFTRAYIDDLAERAAGPHGAALLAELRDRDLDLVERARALLRRTSRGHRWAEELAEQEDLAGASIITTATIAPGVSWLQNESRRIRPAFTREGWRHIDLQLRCPAGAESFFIYAARVIDDRPCADALAELHAGYFKRYVQEWNLFIDTLHVVEPRGYEETRGLIEELTVYQERARNDLQELFAAVARHADLPAPGSESVAPAGSLIAGVRALVRERALAERRPDPFARRGAVVTVELVRRALEPFYRYGYAPAGGQAPLDAYLELLTRLQGPLGAYLDKEREDAALEEARRLANEVDKLITEQLQNHLREWQSALDRLLRPPIRGLLDEVRRGELDQLTQRWCNEVVDPFDSMRQCYPFTAGAECQATGPELSAVFHPETGALWRLYDASLAPRFPFQGDRYSVAPQGHSSRFKVNPKVADFLTHARELGDVLFPAGAADPRFDLAVQFQPTTGASLVALELDGVSESYNNNFNDRFRTIRWPGQGEPGARLTVQILAGAQEVTGDGYWGLFRLLEKGDLVQEQRFIRVRFRVAGGVELLLSPLTGPGSPIFGRLRPDARPLDVFRAPRLVAPRGLFLGGKSCPNKFGAAL
jgi:type VI secretion system protein ImpL